MTIDHDRDDFLRMCAARIQRLEDYEEVRQLMFRYAEAMDNGFDADAIVALFLEDATWSITPASAISGTYRGRKEIRDFFAGLTREYKWTMHNVGNELIRIADDGLTAVGTWYLVDPCTMLAPESPEEGQAVFIAGRYDNTFAKIEGKWFFQSLTAKLHHVSSWQKGWVIEPWRSSE